MISGYNVIYSLINVIAVTEPQKYVYKNNNNNYDVMQILIINAKDYITDYILQWSCW